MSGIGHILNVGQWALHAQQLGIQVTAHNIANVNTEGYSRQRLLLETGRPTQWRPGQIGTGVRAQAVERVYDQFLGVQLNSALSHKASLDTKAAVYEQVEAIFTWSSDSDLNSELEVFWPAWEELAVHPETIPERLALRQAAMELCHRVQFLAENLTDLRGRINESVKIAVNQANDLICQIADLNDQIQRVEVTGQRANDLRDLRQGKTEKLAALLDIHVWEGDDGMLTVLAPGGAPLVMGIQAWLLACREEAPGQAEVLWGDGKGGWVEITGSVNGGAMGAYLEMRDNRIPELLQELDRWSRALIWEVNVQHAPSVGTAPMTQESSQVPVQADVPLATSDLPFAFGIRPGELHLWIYDQSEPPQPLGRVEVTVDGATTLQDLVDQINADPNNGGRLVATLGPGGILTIAGQGGTGFAVSRDDSHVLAAVGFHTFFSGSGASDIWVAGPILDEASLVGSGIPDDEEGSMSPGDNHAALSLASLREAKVFGNATLQESYSSMVSALGVEAGSTYRTKEYQEAVVQQIRDQQASVSGVNLDEEMVRLMQYQWAYEAAARLIQTGGEMFQTVLELLR